MIKFESARSGHVIPTMNGKYLSSRVDPIRESENWVYLHEHLFVENFDIIVLGVGCGYHLLKLKEKYPSKKIIGIDLHEELILFFNKNCATTHCKSFHLSSHHDSYKAYEYFNEIGVGSFVTLMFRPACIVDTQEYLSILGALTHRISSRNSDVSQFLSVKDICNKFSGEPVLTREQMKWFALREFVK